MANSIQHTANSNNKPYAVRRTPHAVHTPVMLQEVTTAMAPAPGKSFIDATLGAAGHCLALLEKGAEVVGIDRDEMILAIANKRVADAGFSDHFHSLHATFADALSSTDLVDGGYDGVLFDLGVSSLQLDTPERGFAIMYDAPLDMRMDSRLAVTAADLVNGLGRKELVELFELLGEEHSAKKIANAIADRRKVKPVRTTRELAELVEGIVPRTGKIHPATKVFQALRMAVNSERSELKAALPSALSKLSPNGVMAVISFHSLEDKIVKDFMTEMAQAGKLQTSGNPETPTASEILANPRSRSAKLRIGRKQ